MTVLDELRGAFPDLVTDPDILASLARDAADLFGDVKTGSALAAVRPTTTEQVATAVRIAAAHRVPVQRPLSLPLRKMRRGPARVQPGRSPGSMLVI